MTLACEDANSKLVEFITVADADADKRVEDSLEAEVWSKKSNFCSNFEHMVWSRF